MVCKYLFHFVQKMVLGSLLLFQPGIFLRNLLFICKKFVLVYFRLHIISSRGFFSEKVRFKGIFENNSQRCVIHEFRYHGIGHEKKNSMRIFVFLLHCQTFAFSGTMWIYDIFPGEKGQKHGVASNLPLGRSRNEFPEIDRCARVQTGRGRDIFSRLSSPTFQPVTERFPPRLCYFKSPLLPDLNSTTLIGKLRDATRGLGVGTSTTPMHFWQVLNCDFGSYFVRVWAAQYRFIYDLSLVMEILMEEVFFNQAFYRFFCVWVWL